MNRRELLGAIGASLGVFGFGLTRSVRADDDTASPQSDAIALVIKKQQKEIGEAEAKYFKEHGTDWWKGGLERYRWHDIVTRSWASTRFARPGVVDSTHIFVVSYSIGAKEVASWTVDTEKKKATLNGPPNFVDL